MKAGDSDSMGILPKVVKMKKTDSGMCGRRRALEGSTFAFGLSNQIGGAVEYYIIFMIH